MPYNKWVKLWLFGFSTVLTMGSFQNCAQSQGKESNSYLGLQAGLISSDSSENLINNENEKIEFSKATALELSLNSLFANNVRYRADEQSLRINFSNGEMRVVSPDGREANQIRYCLFPDELSELKTLIFTAKVCDGNDAADDGDVVCTTQYVYPYARVEVDNNKLVNLGERSGCIRGLDLCDTYKKNLNGFISYLKIHLEDRKCL